MLDAGAILPFVPLTAKVDQGKDKASSTVFRLLAENSCIHNIAAWILQTQPWDFLAVYDNVIHHLSHAFMHCHPPRMEGLPEDKFEIYKDVVNGSYRFQDFVYGDDSEAWRSRTDARAQRRGAQARNPPEAGGSIADRQ